MQRDDGWLVDIKMTPIAISGEIMKENCREKTNKKYNSMISYMIHWSKKTLNSKIEI